MRAGPQTPSRDEAYRILRRVEREEAYSSLLLQQLDPRLDPRDVGLITELVLGVLRRRSILDRAIATFASRPPDQLDEDVRLILMIAFYQILFLDRIPPHAAVNEAVGMARRLTRGRAAAGAFVNGVLRAALRDRPALGRAGPRGADRIGAIAMEGSHPEWLVARWAARLGLPEAGRLVEANNRPAPVSVRVNGRRTTAARLSVSLGEEFVSTRPSRYLDEFLVSAGGALHRTAAFARGEFYIQDEATGLVARLAAARPGDRVLDACAAPGGKTLALAEAAGEEGVVVAGDLRPSRLRLLRENAERLGLPGCLPLAADFSSDPPLVRGTLFDVVLVDAPCTGTGVIRRNPELRYRVTGPSIQRLAALQARLLEVCAGLVRPGGALIYSVCSLEPEEGESQIVHLLKVRPEYSLEDPAGLLPAAAAPLLAGIEGGRALITWPQRDELDGFFAARLRRRTSVDRAPSPETGRPPR